MQQLQTLVTDTTNRRFSL